MTKILSCLTLLLAMFFILLPFPILAYLFTIPSNFASSAVAYVGILFNGLKYPIYILIGFFLFFWVGNWVIGKFKQKEKLSEAEKFFKEGGLYSRGKGRPRREWNIYKKKWE